MSVFKYFETLKDSILPFQQPIVNTSNSLGIASCHNNLTLLVISLGIASCHNNPMLLVLSLGISAYHNNPTLHY